MNFAREPGYLAALELISHRPAELAAKPALIKRASRKVEKLFASDGGMAGAKTLPVLRAPILDDDTLQRLKEHAVYTMLRAAQARVSEALALVNAAAGS